MARPDNGHWLFTVRSLPLMFETLSHLGCIHQSMLIFHLQRAALMADPEISEGTLARLCDAIIQRYVDHIVAVTLLDPTAVA